MMLNRFFSLALSGAIVFAVGVSGGPAWCLEATQEQNLALLKAIDADLAKKPNDTLLLLKHAEMMGLLQRYVEQVDEANKLIKKNPNLRDAYLIRSDGEANQKRYAEALVSLDKAFSLGSPTPKLLLYKARYQRNEKKYSEALKTINMVIKADPTNVAAYKCRSECYFRLNGSCIEALQDMEKVVALNPSDVAAKSLVEKLKNELATKSAAGLPNTR